MVEFDESSWIGLAVVVGGILLLILIYKMLAWIRAHAVLTGVILIVIVLAVVFGAWLIASAHSEFEKQIKREKQQKIENRSKEIGELEK